MDQFAHSIRLELAAEDIGERTGGRSKPASPVAARLAAAARASRAAPSAQRLAERLLAAERRRKVSQRRNSPTEHTTPSLRRKEKERGSAQRRCVAGARVHSQSIATPSLHPWRPSRNTNAPLGALTPHTARGVPCENPRGGCGGGYSVRV